MLWPRKYTRFSLYSLSAIAAFYILHHSYYYFLLQHVPISAQRHTLTPTHDPQSINEHVMVDIGLQYCLHIGTWWQFCPWQQKLFNYHFNDDDHDDDLDQVTRITIAKHIDYYNSWISFNKIFFYDTININKLNTGSIGKFNLFTNISTTPLESDDNQLNLTFHNLHLSVKSLDSNSIYSTPIITDFTFLFGIDCKEPRDNWHLCLDNPWSVYKDQPIYISYKLQQLKPNDNENGVKFTLPNTTHSQKLLTVNANGKFKILQLADLHMGIGEGKCRDEFPPQIHKEDKCLADTKTFKFIDQILNLENPDLIVFSGDQIMGDLSKMDSQSVLLKILDPIIKKNIPWCMIWGNHDDEGSLNRWQLSEFVHDLPGSLFKFSPLDTNNNEFGVGNYPLQIMSNNTNSDANALITLYFFDSHKYSTMGKIYPGYDWIKEPQWSYMQNLYNHELKSKIANLQTHLSMAFFHIPLPEYLNFDSRLHSGEKNKIVGNYKEGITAPKFNSGGLSVLEQMGVQVTSCGHDHVNDYCLNDDSTNRNIWLCYGGSVGEGAYAGYGGTERRVRLFEFDTVSNVITTWKRLHESPRDITDFQELVRLS